MLLTSPVLCFFALLKHPRIEGNVLHIKFSELFIWLPVWLDLAIEEGFERHIPVVPEVPQALDHFYDWAHLDPWPIKRCLFIGLLWKFLGTVQDSESMDFDRTKATTSHDGKMMIYLKLSFERTIMATSARFVWLKFGPKSNWTSRAICSGTIFAVEQLPRTTCVKLSSLQSSTWRKPSGKSGSLEVVALKHQHSKDSPLHCWLATLLHKIKVHENPIIRPERTNASVCVCVFVFVFVFVFVCFCVCMSALIGSDCSNSCRGRSTLN